MRIVVCDDNAEFGSELAQFIRDNIMASSYYDDGLKVEYIQSSKALVSYLDNFLADILFLDIAMPELDGFDIAQYINERELSVCLIFVSSFESNVFYSLRYKPFRFVRKEKYKEEIPEALVSAYKELTAKNRYIMITKQGDVIPVRLSRIIYAEKEKRSNYMSIYTADDVYRYRGTLSDFAALTEGAGFVRVSQNAYVNMENITSIKSNTVYMKGGAEYYIPPKYRPSVLQEFFEFMREE